jgi:murein L,D-transpeptidase YafK
MKSRTVPIACLALLLPTLAAAQNGAPPGMSVTPRADLLHYGTPLTQWLHGKHPNRRDILLRIEKSRYRLIVCYRNRALKSYPVVFGCNPLGDKQQQGDCRTPEGRFTIKAAYPHRAWSKFLWIDYPDAAAKRRFALLKRQGKIPANADIGGEIGIHGVPNRADYLIETRRNWTRGCISLKTPDIEELYTVAGRGTRVEIVR